MYNQNREDVLPACRTRARLRAQLPDFQLPAERMRTPLDHNGCVTAQPPAAQCHDSSSQRLYCLTVCIHRACLWRVSIFRRPCGLGFEESIPGGDTGVAH